MDQNEHGELTRLLLANDLYPMHMPGHKRNPAFAAPENPYAMDVTEIAGTDNLAHPEGVLRRLSERAASIWGADETLLLVNGSTVGNLAAVTGAFQRGDTVIAARNSHKSVYHALRLWDLKTIWVEPEAYRFSENRMVTASFAGPVTRQLVERAYGAHPEAKGVILTSPTYEGVISEVPEIAAFCHAHGLLLLVDEAHGAHLGFHPYFPESAVKAGADLVVQSLHKTLPALTQTALLHMNGSRVDRERVRGMKNVFQTSSPSYVLIASMEQCMETLTCEKAPERWKAYAEELQDFYRACGGRVVPEAGDRDPSKLLIRGNGPALHRYLREAYRIEPEMEAADYLLAMTSFCDTAEGFRRLKQAVCAAPEQLLTEPPARMLHRFPEGLAGRISLEFVWAYPPGIPILAPGEEITEAVLARIRALEAAGIELSGMAEPGQLKTAAPGNEQE